MENYFLFHSILIRFGPFSAPQAIMPRATGIGQTKNSKIVKCRRQKLRIHLNFTVKNRRYRSLVLFVQDFPTFSPNGKKKKKNPNLANCQKIFMTTNSQTLVDEGMRT